MEIDSLGKRAGKGALIRWEQSMTLGVSQDQTLFAWKENGIRPSHRGDGYKETGIMYTLNSTEVHAVCFGISPYHSNAMKSSNPHSGIYIADTSRSLDAMNCGYPACNQGGICVVEIHST